MHSSIDYKENLYTIHIQDFLFQFQTLLKSAGAQGKPTVFLLTDTQIKEESFLEDVDSLLNTGEVANLFAVDEKAEINEVSMAKINVL